MIELLSFLPTNEKLMFFFPFVFKFAGLSSFSPLFPLPARLLTIFLVSFIVIAET